MPPLWPGWSTTSKDSGVPDKADRQHLILIRHAFEAEHRVVEVFAWPKGPKKVTWAPSLANTSSKNVPFALQLHRPRYSHSQIFQAMLILKPIFGGKEKSVEVTGAAESHWDFTTQAALQKLVWHQGSSTSVRSRAERRTPSKPRLKFLNLFFFTVVHKSQGLGSSAISLITSPLWVEMFYPGLVRLALPHLATCRACNTPPV